MLPPLPGAPTDVTLAGDASALTVQFGCLPSWDNTDSWSYTLTRTDVAFVATAGVAKATAGGSVAKPASGQPCTFTIQQSTLPEAHQRGTFHISLVRGGSGVPTGCAALPVHVMYDQPEQRCRVCALLQCRQPSTWLAAAQSRECPTQQCWVSAAPVRLCVASVRIKGSSAPNHVPHLLLLRRRAAGSRPCRC